MSTTELASSPALNRKLLRHARKSPKEIEALTGIPAHEVMERMAVLLEDRGWRDARMEERLIMMEIGELVEDMRKRLDEVEDDAAYAKMATALLANLKTLLDRLDRNTRQSDEDMLKVNQAQARVMAEAIQLAMERAVFELQKKYPEVDADEVNDIFMAGLPEAVARIERDTL